MTSIKPCILVSMHWHASFLPILWRSFDDTYICSNYRGSHFCAQGRCMALARFIRLRTRKSVMKHGHYVRDLVLSYGQTLILHASKPRACARLRSLVLLDTLPLDSKYR